MLCSKIDKCSKSNINDQNKVFLTVNSAMVTIGIVFNMLFLGCGKIFR